MNTKESILIVMDHWERESNKEVRDYIVEQITIND